MNIEDFFSHFLNEIKESNYLGDYYKFHKNKSSFLFRKNYFFQRLNFIKKNIKRDNCLIWDCGCGYGTTSIFLTLNGYNVFGNTLGNYYKKIPERMEYWSQFGDVSKFEYSYADVFDLNNIKKGFDYMIAQDSLHHIEPVNKAIGIFYNSLKADGKIIAIEENGKNILQRIKDFYKRGTKRKKVVFDEVLSKEMDYGEENTRSFKEWENLFHEHKMYLNDFEYIRLYMPFLWTEKNYKRLSEKEKLIWKRNKFLRDYFYFGINFTAVKKNPKL